MAYHRKLVLPAFKVTTHTTSGAVVEKDLPRGFKSNENKATVQEAPESSSPVEDATQVYPEFSPDPGPPGPGLYEISQKVSVSAWKKVRHSLLKAVTESNAMPSNQLCTICCEPTLAMFRCIQCGPCVYFCASCLPTQHLQSNIFHVPEEWKVRF